MRKEFLVLIVLFTLFVIPYNGSAYSNIGLELSEDKISGCPGYAIEVDLTVTNFDDVTHTYFLSLELPQGWEIPDNGFMQPDLILASGETEKITFFVNPPTVESGEYTVKVKAKNGGEEAYKDLKVEVLRCHDVYIQTEEMLEVCKDSEFEYGFKVTNNGKGDETFEVTVSGSWSQDFLFKDSIVIVSGETEEIDLDLTSPMENGKITVKADSKDSYAKDEKHTELKVGNCYDFGIDLEPEGATVCLSSSAKFVLTIINLGTETDEYEIQSPEWVVPSQENVTVSPGKEKSVGFFAYPEIAGETSFDVTVKSKNYPKLKKTTTGSVKAEECKGLAVIVTPADQEICKGLPIDFEVAVKNTGMISDTYDLETDVGTLEKNKVIVEPGKIEKVKLTVDTSELEAGETLITVRGKSGEISDQNSVPLTVQNCYSAEFGVSPEEFEVCEGEQINYTLILKNTGELKDDYTFFLEDEEIGFALLGPDELKMYSTKIKIEFIEGEYDLKFKAVSDEVSEEATAKLSVKSREKCYNVDLSSDETEKIVEPGKGTAIGVKVENSGERDDNFVLSLEGPEWVHLSENLVSLEGGEETYVYLYVSPGYDVEKGMYEITFSAESTKADESLNFKMGVGVTEEEMNITKPQEEPNMTIDIVIPTGAVVGVTGETGKVILLAVIVLLIIIILAVKFVLFVK